MDLIRVSTPAELQECFGIRRQVFVIEQEVPVELEIDQYDDSPDACRHLLLREQGRPVATGRFHPYLEETVKFQRIAVLQEERGTGVGTALVLGMESWARELGFTYVILDSQCHAEPFYEKLGYTKVSPEVFLDAGIPHVRMKKEITSSERRQVI